MAFTSSDDLSKKKKKVALKSATTPKKKVVKLGSPKSSEQTFQATSSEDAITKTRSFKDTPADKSSGEMPSSPRCWSIPGIGDRMHHLALFSSAPHTALQGAKPVKKDALSGIRPVSAVECQRKAGAGKFCDPNNTAGCGGKFCGQHARTSGSNDFI